MKLQDIPIGGRFEYDGKIFTKTGPLTASAEPGGQRMIPRYANLLPLDIPVPQSKLAGMHRKLDEAAVQTAFHEFHRRCAELLDESSLPALAEARQRFMDTLKLR